MSNRVLLAAVLVACAGALRGEETHYQIQVVPAGRIISTDAPALKGNTYLFHTYPSGTFVSIRTDEVRQISKISSQAVAATNPALRIVPIGTVQRNSSQAGLTNLSAVRRAQRGPSRAKTSWKEESEPQAPPKPR